MIININKELFTNNDTVDFINSTGNTLRINKLQEAFSSSSTRSSSILTMDYINIELYLGDGSVQLSTIVGFDNDYISLSTDYPELVGKRLTTEMFGKVVLDFFESEVVEENLIYVPTQTLRI